MEKSPRRRIIKWLLSSLLVVVAVGLAVYFGIGTLRYRQYLAVKAKAQRAGLVTSLKQLRSATPVAENDDAVPILFDTCQLMPREFIQQSRYGLSKLGMVQLTNGDQARLEPWLKTFQPVFQTLTDAASKPGCSFPGNDAQAEKLNLTSKILVAERALLVRSIYENAERQPAKALQTLGVVRTIASDVAAQADMNAAYAANSLDVEVERQVADILGSNPMSPSLLSQAKGIVDGISVLDPQVLLRGQVAEQLSGFSSFSPTGFDRMTFSFSHRFIPGSLWMAQSEVLDYAVRARVVLAGNGSQWQKQQQLAQMGTQSDGTSAIEFFNVAQFFAGLGRIPANQALVQTGKAVLEYAIATFQGGHPATPVAFSPQLPIVTHREGGVFTASALYQNGKGKESGGVLSGDIGRGVIGRHRAVSKTAQL